VGPDEFVEDLKNSKIPKLRIATDLHTKLTNEREQEIKKYNDQQR